MVYQLLETFMIVTAYTRDSSEGRHRSFEVETTRDWRSVYTISLEYP